MNQNHNRFQHIRSPAVQRSVKAMSERIGMQDASPAVSEDKRIALGEEAFAILINMLHVPPLKPTASHAEHVENSTRRVLREYFEGKFKP